MLTRLDFFKRTAALAVCATCAVSLTACGGSADGSYKIGVLQLTQHSALDAANEGFVKAIEDSGLDVDIDQQNASNDQSSCQTIANKFVTDGDDLIFAIGTPAAQAAAGATADIPVVGTAITDFAESGLVESNDAPGGNVTGTSDLTPVAEQLELMTKILPDVKTVGILYCTAEANSKIQVEMAEKELAKLGIEAKLLSVSSSNEIQSVTESAVGEVDALYTPTDNTIASGMAQIAQIALENGIPTVCGEQAHVDAGGLFSLSIDYEQLGYKAGEMAAKILSGEAAPADMPIEQLDADDLKIVVNDETAKALGIDTTPLTE